jgi:hypothetical protein
LRRGFPDFQRAHAASLGAMVRLQVGRASGDSPRSLLTAERIRANWDRNRATCWSTIPKVWTATCLRSIA